jgi:hypothetical protein
MKILNKNKKTILTLGLSLALIGMFSPMFLLTSCGNGDSLLKRRITPTKYKAVIDKGPQS